MQSTHKPLFFIEEDIKQQPHPQPQSQPSQQRPRAQPPAIRASLNPRNTARQQPQKLPSPIIPNRSSFSSSTTTTNNELEDILSFPIESSHAYSYAHLSPNSLALRLNVLKRSLEILKDRPDLFRSLTKEVPESTGELSRTTSNQMEVDSTLPEDQELDSQAPPPPPSRKSLFTHTNHSSDYIHDVSPGHTNDNKKYKLRSNASSATLAALFRPNMKRSDSLPLEVPPTVRRVSTPPISSLPSNKTAARKTSLNTPQNDDFKDIIDLLENDLEALINNSEIATTLHDLSLSTSPDDSTSINSKHDILKNKLLLALAMPFMETSVQATSLLESDGTSDPSLNKTHIRPSTTALNLLNNNYPSSPVMSSSGPSFNTNNNNSSSRPFHPLLTTKHSLPQSVFTIEPDLPFSVKAANDLACLMFGVLKSTIKALTLMDLIAPQFRNFVMERLTSLPSTNLRGNKSQDRILFAGEIVAIVRPGDQNFAWTSLWAKRKGNLIICMFDQIPCDAFDVVIMCHKDSSTFEVESVNNIAGSLVADYGINALTTLQDLSDSLNEELHEVQAEARDETEDVAVINHTRYYTLQLEEGNNVPCAITSNQLDVSEDKHEIKLKIHTLPYIAGIFVIDSSNYNILSCNNAIARNLFGKSFDDINNHSIDELIPNFTKILKVGIESSLDSSQVAPGLVLPEHFFRRYDAVVKKSEDPDCEESADDIFFNSHGVEGIHRDGKEIYVDVQLRASSQDTLVVWITYSRTNKNKNCISEELDKLSSASASSVSLSSSNKSATSLSTSSKTRSVSSYLRVSDIKGGANRHERAMSTDVPSQMKLFDNEKENDLLEFSPREVTRKLSTRRPRKETEFGLPLTKLDSYIYSGDEKSTAQNLLTPIETRELIELENTAPSSPSVTNSDFHIASKYTEKDILELENQSLEKIKKESSLWPEEVGAHRRTKKFSEFKVVKNMGEGAYGKVVLAQHKEDKYYKIIIKCINKERILVDTWVRDRKLGTIPSEIQIMAYLNSEPHPNIMRIVDFFEDLKYYYLETPIFGNPPAIDLFDFIEIKKDLNEVECQFIFKQIISSIYHLHQNGIVHRDIKDENIIVDEKGVIKLIDFGSAGYVRQGPFDVFVGTIDYASPEVLRGEKYEGKPQDIWALGILLYTMLYKENPFYNVDEIMEGDLRIPYVISDSSLSLIRKILIRDVEHRPTITDIMEDEWLA
ncbi:Serine/threonine-protein kinase PSK1 [Candida viswanathii]|uniref:non-specific serine/threonine protein kinase n=1 Tax=Candida viswanathii TaxID=5486 RepID=A0A367YHK0_9ASCO|nr:Serine/threonine-protein kinase PSK1 [Candida viswanathii]